MFIQKIVGTDRWDWWSSYQHHPCPHFLSSSSRRTSQRSSAQRQRRLLSTANDVPRDVIIWHQDINNKSNRKPKQGLIFQSRITVRINYVGYRVRYRISCWILVNVNILALIFCCQMALTPLPWQQKSVKSKNLWELLFIILHVKGSSGDWIDPYKREKQYF